MYAKLCRVRSGYKKVTQQMKPKWFLTHVNAIGYIDVFTISMYDMNNQVKRK